MQPRANAGLNEGRGQPSSLAMSTSLTFRSGENALVQGLVQRVFIHITLCSSFRWAGEEFKFESPMKGIPAAKLDHCQTIRPQLTCR